MLLLHLLSFLPLSPTWPPASEQSLSSFSLLLCDETDLAMAHRPIESRFHSCIWWHEHPIVIYLLSVVLFPDSSFRLTWLSSTGEKKGKLQWKEKDGTQRSRRAVWVGRDVQIIGLKQGSGSFRIEPCASVFSVTMWWAAPPLEREEKKIQIWALRVGNNDVFYLIVWCLFFRRATERWNVVFRAEERQVTAFVLILGSCKHTLIEMHLFQWRMNELTVEVIK